MKKIIFVLVIFSMLISIQAQDFKRYNVKSGIIEYKIEGNTEGTEILYFDNYGEKEAKRTKTKTTIMGFSQESDQLTLMDGKMIYMADFNTKTITKTENPSWDMMQELMEEGENLEEFGKKMMEQMGGKIIGTETLNGKKCDVWEIQSMGTKSWVYESIPLKIETNLMGMKIKYVVTKLELDVSVPSDVFVLPEGFSEQDAPDMEEMMKQMQNMMKKK